MVLNNSSKSLESLESKETRIIPTLLKTTSNRESAFEQSTFLACNVVAFSLATIRRVVCRVDVLPRTGGVNSVTVNSDQAVE